MGGGASGAASGGIIGLVLALLGQQLGYLDFGPIGFALLLIGAYVTVNALIFGIIGGAIGRRYIRRHSPVAEWKAGPAPESPSEAPKP